MRCYLRITIVWNPKNLIGTTWNTSMCVCVDFHRIQTKCRKMHTLALLSCIWSNQIGAQNTGTLWDYIIFGYFFFFSVISLLRFVPPSHLQTMGTSAAKHICIDSITMTLKSRQNTVFHSYFVYSAYKTFVSVLSLRKNAYKSDNLMHSFSANALVIYSSKPFITYREL